MKKQQYYYNQWLYRIPYCGSCISCNEDTRATTHHCNQWQATLVSCQMQDKLVWQENHNKDPKNHHIKSFFTNLCFNDATNNHTQPLYVWIFNSNTHAPYNSCSVLLFNKAIELKFIEVMNFKSWPSKLCLIQFCSCMNTLELFSCYSMGWASMNDARATHIVSPWRHVHII